MAGHEDRVDFFVSHAGPDSDWAEWIGQRLLESGYSVELDVWDWSAGVDVIAAMERGLTRARRVLGVWTPAYFERRWTGVELRAAFAHGQHEPGWLVPVTVEPCDDAIPIMYRTLLRIDLTGLDERAASERLLSGIMPSGRPAGPVAFPGGLASGSARPSAPVAFPGRLPPVWGPVPAQNLFFTGRNELLADLHGRLVTGTGHVAVAALHGMGGVGKTQLAAEYAWRHAAEYDLVWWVDADADGGLAAGLADLAVELGIQYADVPRRARQALAELGRRTGWLLVYDNVTDSGALARFMPPATGRMIVTCRDRRLARTGVTLLEVGEFARTETVGLLRRHLPDLPPAAAERLGDALGDLPLAIDQAGAYLAETGMDLDSYLHLLAEQPHVALADEAPRHPGLVSTVNTACARLAQERPDAAALLNQLAFLAPEPVPLAATPPGRPGPIPGGLAVAGPAATYDMIAAISRLALARHSGTSIRMHRLVHALVRARLTTGQITTAFAAALRLLATGYPGSPHEPANWPEYSALTTHISAVVAHLNSIDGVDEPDDFRSLVDAQCWYLYRTGQYQASRTLAGQIRSRWAATLGEDHLDVHRISTVLAAALHATGEYQAARERTEDTLARQRRLYGEDDVETLLSASHLASHLSALGNHQLALDMLRDTVARQRRTLGADHPDTLRSADNLAGDFIKAGDYTAARDLSEETLGRHRILRGDDHPETLMSAHNLTIALLLLGDLQNARELAEDTLARSRRVLGPDHPDTQAAAGLIELHDEAERSRSHSNITRTIAAIERAVYGDGGRADS